MATIEDGFRRTLASFSAQLAPEQMEDFKFTKLEDVQVAVMTIQAQQEKRMEMMNMKRIQSFLEAMDGFRKVVEVFLNSSMFLPFIWGPIKFLLQVACSWADSFDTLLEAYRQIAENMPLLQQYRTLFEKNHHMVLVLEMIYKSILEFHLSALAVFRKPTWRQLFRSVWKDFKTRFQNILDDLRRYRSLIETQANLIQIQESQREHSRNRESFSKMEEAERDKRMLSVINWLSPADVDHDQEALVAVRQEHPGSGLWLFANDQVKTWIDPDSSLVPCLWLNGIPGAVLASVVIEQCLEIPSITCIFFYCKYRDKQRDNFPAAARTMLVQILRQNGDLLPYLYEKCIASGQISLTSIQLCKELLDTAVKSVSKAYIIIDGIDECEPSEWKLILSSLVTTVESAPPGSLRCMFVSQDENDIRQLLRRASVVRLVENDNRADIENFAQLWSSKIQQKFDLSPDPGNFIVNVVCNGSEGMFLFTRLVLVNLYGQVSRADLLEELEPGRFPKGLDQAYGRVVHRIFNNPNPAERRVAQRLLGWMVCAKRSMKWHEIQGAISINLQKKLVDFDARRLRVDARDLCGSLLEVHSGDRVDLVHRTARGYLIQQEYVQISEEEENLALLCLRYLVFDCFDKSLEEEDIQEFIVDGHYAFEDYAALHWVDHLESLSEDQQLDLMSLNSALKHFCEKYEVDGESNSVIWQGPMHNQRATTKNVLFELIGPLINEAKTKRAQDENVTALGILGAAMLARRAIVEQLAGSLSIGSDTRKDFECYYGQNWYKCPKHPCFYFHEGFPSAALRDRHVQRHEKPFGCTEIGCVRSQTGFSSEKELEKHVQINHADPEALSWKFSKVKEKDITSGFQCSACSKSFTRKYALRLHQRSQTQGPFVCLVCGESFAQLCKFGRHMKAHRGRIDATCGGRVGDADSGLVWGCGKRFMRRETLVEHVRWGQGDSCRGQLVQSEAAARDPVNHQDLLQDILNGTQKGNTFLEELKKKYPDLKYVSVGQWRDATRLIMEGRRSVR